MVDVRKLNDSPELVNVLHANTEVSRLAPGEILVPMRRRNWEVALVILQRSALTRTRYTFTANKWLMVRWDGW